MIDLRWVERGVSSKDGEPLLHQTIERVLQYRVRKCLVIGDGIYAYGSGWGGWRDVSLDAEVKAK